MANKKLWGILALMLVFGMAAFVVSCGGDEDDGGNTPGVTGKPTQLPQSNSVTAAQAYATLNAIIAYSGTPSTTKESAQSMKDNWNTTYGSSWATSWVYALSAINGLISTIP